MNITLRQSSTHEDGKFRFDEMIAHKIENLETSARILRSQEKLLEFYGQADITVLRDITHNLCVIAPHRSHLIAPPMNRLALAAFRLVRQATDSEEKKQAQTNLKQVLALLGKTKKHDTREEEDNKSVMDHSLLLQNIHAATANTHTSHTTDMQEALLDFARTLKQLNRNTLEETQEVFNRYKKLKH